MISLISQAWWSEFLRNKFTNSIRGHRCGSTMMIKTRRCASLITYELMCAVFSGNDLKQCKDMIYNKSLKMKNSIGCHCQMILICLVEKPLHLQAFKAFPIVRIHYWRYSLMLKVIPISITSKLGSILKFLRIKIRNYFSMILIKVYWHKWPSLIHSKELNFCLIILQNYNKSCRK